MSDDVNLRLTTHEAVCAERWRETILRIKRIEALMIGLPALSLLLVLPISISGWGLREATLTSVLALWGVSPSLTVLGSISFGAMTVLCILPGAYVLLKRK